MIFEFVIPVGKATSQMRSAVKEMQRQQQANQQTAQQQQTQPTSYNHSPVKPKDDDYIEFEEIKN